VPPFWTSAARLIAEWTIDLLCAGTKRERSQPSAVLRTWIVAFSFAAGLLTCARPAGAVPSPIRHVVIILQENRTFENIFHSYPGAHTVNAGKSKTGKIPLQAVHLMTLWDPKHRYASWLQQYDGGAMDGFDLETLDFGNGAPAHFAYSYAMQSDVQPYWDMAKSGALADEFFADHRSQSFSGHQYPIAGASGPITPELPNYYASDNPKHGQNCDTLGTGPAINLATGAQDKTYNTCFDYKTIADLVKAKGLSWRFYVDSPEATVSYISSFSVIKHIRDDPQAWQNVVSPAATVLDDAQNDKLPSVAYVVGAFADSDHAGQDVPSSNGPSWVASVVNAIGRGPAWDSTVVFLTYDDWGGWYDEVRPPVQFNAFEPGFRLPFVAVSPYARRGYISHVTHYWGSVLHFCETTFGLGSLQRSDARSDDLHDMFDFTQADGLDRD
jgi:phospholipase C